MKKLLNKVTSIAGSNSGIASGTSKALLILAFAFISSVGVAQKKDAHSGTPNTKTQEKTLHDFYRSYIAAANARDFDAIATIVAENVTLNGVAVKREDIITEFKKLVEAVPDLTWNIEHLVAEEDRIAARLQDTGTPKATTFFGQNPHGKSIKFTEYGSYKVRNGLFVEMSYLIDVPSISQQLKK
jgi:predicted ester cyclase